MLGLFFCSYNGLKAKNHKIRLQRNSALFLKHIVPTFEHDAVQYLQATYQLLHQNTQINQIPSNTIPAVHT